MVAMVKPNVREHFDLRYVSSSRGNLYWKPRKRDAEEFGFARSYPLGRGVDAWRAADKLNKKLDKARAGESIADEPKKVYKPGTLGSFFDKFRETPKWETMDARTREDYWRAWEVIEPRYGDWLVSRITAIESERFHLAIHPVHNKNKRDPERLTWPKAWRVLKGWRGLLNAMEAYGVKKKAPIGRISNPPPPGRTQRWDFDEVEALIKTADEVSCPGMACAIATAWDTLFSPGDARLLVPRELMRDSVGFYIHTDRVKTGKFVDAPISDDTAARIAKYMATRGAIGDDDVIFVSRTGRPWKDHKEFGKEFRIVREAAFEGDKRQFLDIRRSGNTEAWVGGEDRENLAAALGNRIDKNDRLWETYTPPTLAAAREVQQARTVGRARLQATKKAKA
jgi:hypothetical protein